MYRTILVPLDGSALSEHALPLALGVARSTNAAVQLVHVCTPPHAYLNDGLAALAAPPPEPCREHAIRYLNTRAKELSPRWGVPIDVAVREGLAADQLYAHAIGIAADLVVLTTHGYGPLSRMWVGSVADTLVRRLPMPVMLTRPHQEAQDVLKAVHDQVFQHVLLPLDGSKLAEEILEPTLMLGTSKDVTFTLLQAIQVPVIGYAPLIYAARLDEQILEQMQADARAYLDQVAERLRGQGYRVATQISLGPPALAILDYAREHAVDLIAMATHGRGGVARLLLGSVADKVVRGATTPVLLQRPCVEAIVPHATADRLGTHLEDQQPSNMQIDVHA
jgi:nucleotide-binding universal stress UspA family protein